MWLRAQFNSAALKGLEKGGWGFSFPWFYSGCHMIASFIGVNVIFQIKPALNTLSREQWKAKWLPLLSLSVLMVLNIGCNNESLVYIGLSVNQIIKSITPLPTMVLSFFIEKKRYTWLLIAAVVVQVLGAIAAVPWHDNDQAATFGIILCLVSMLAAATKPVLAGSLMKDMRESGLSPLVLVWYDSLFSIFWIFIVSVAKSEPIGVINFMRDQPALGWGIILIGSSLAFSYNIVVFYLTKVTSSLTNVILANIKQVRLATSCLLTPCRISAPRPRVSCPGALDCGGRHFHRSHLTLVQHRGHDRVLPRFLRVFLHHIHGQG